MNNNVSINGSNKHFNILGLGCWAFGGEDSVSPDDGLTMEIMQKAWDSGIRHWDTAISYGGGHSEKVCGAFLKDKWDEVFLASKGFVGKRKDSILNALNKSLENLNTDHIDLYYIHWPNSKVDMRPSMESLMSAREKGLISSIGVSNFSVEQLRTVSEAGRIDVVQLCYNALWRYEERDVIPWCRENGISVVTYSSIAQGILTGKFPENPEFSPRDARSKTIFFDPDVWPFIYEATRKMKRIADQAGRPMHHLAMQWVARQPGISGLLVGARNPHQVEANVAALIDPVSRSVIDEITKISDETVRHIPDVGNIFRFYP